MSKSLKVILPALIVATGLVLTTTFVALSQPVLPAGPQPPASVVTLDPVTKIRIARDATTNDTASTNMTSGSFTALVSSSGDSAVNALQWVRGAKSVLLMLYASNGGGGANNATCTVTILGWKKGVTSLASHGLTLGVFPVTFGSDATTNGDPYGYDSTSNGGWYAMDTVTETKDASSNSLSSNVVYDGAGDNRVAQLVFDPKGCDAFYVKITLMSGANRVRAYWWAY